MQTRRHSLLESVTNVAVGYGVAVVSQVLIFPLYGIHIPLHDNLAIGLWFTVISLVRSYILRRWFNQLTYQSFLPTLREAFIPGGKRGRS